jgi:hypothetical protein
VNRACIYPGRRDYLRAVVKLLLWKGTLGGGRLRQLLSGSILQLGHAGAVGRLPRESGKQYTIPTHFYNQPDRLKRTIRQRPLLWLQL